MSDYCNDKNKKDVLVHSELVHKQVEPTSTPRKIKPIEPTKVRRTSYSFVKTRNKGRPHDSRHVKPSGRPLNPTIQPSSTSVFHNLTRTLTK